jgi:L,D-transpeptidase YcbB
MAALAGVCALLGHASNQFLPNEMNEYLRTLNALEHYRALAAEDDGEILPEAAKPVEAGEHYDGVPRLTRLLRMTGDLPYDLVSDDPGLYDDGLAGAVQQFQRRHGLEPDGRLDQATLAQLNTPLAFRVHQLELALERWRRRPYDPSRPAIVLNLPEFRLRAFGAQNQPELEMKIIVGRAPENRTPLLSSQLESVVFRPYWNVPARIQQEELLPKIMNDPSYLTAKHLEIVTMQGRVVKGAVSDDILADLRSGSLRLRQIPGPENALGLAMFGFPNKYEVLMHSTSAEGLFDRPRRDLSHGCIRLERAEDMAVWALRELPGWTRDRIVDAMQGSETIAVKLKRPIQVVTMYATAIVTEDGEVQFFNDIYGEDAALERELAGALSSSGR